MTVFLHSAIPATIVYKTTGNFWLSLLAAVLGTYPDTISNKYYSLFPNQRMYNKLHRPWLWLKKWKLAAVLFAYFFVWPSGLHVGMDYPVHTDDDSTRNIYFYAFVESVCWIWILNTLGIMKWVGL